MIIMMMMMLLSLNNYNEDDISGSGFSGGWDHCFSLFLVGPLLHFTRRAHMAVMVMVIVQVMVVMVIVQAHM